MTVAKSEKPYFHSKLLESRKAYILALMDLYIFTKKNSQENKVLLGNLAICMKTANGGSNDIHRNVSTTYNAIINQRNDYNSHLIDDIISTRRHDLFVANSAGRNKLINKRRSYYIVPFIFAAPFLGLLALGIFLAATHIVTNTIIALIIISIGAIVVSQAFVWFSNDQKELLRTNEETHVSRWTKVSNLSDKIQKDCSTIDTFSGNVFDNDSISTALENVDKSHLQLEQGNIYKFWDSMPSCCLDTNDDYAAGSRLS
ncbi:MAG: hypothetical protein P1U74_09815 [Legionellaceae bacterium]|nr:hypothetical protein [Legionellaceae bacterium]